MRPSTAAGRRGVGSALSDEILAQHARRRQTQAWLAAEAGVPIATLSRRLRDSSSFRPGELARIALALNVGMNELLAL